MPRIPTSRGQQVREQAFRSGGFNVKAPVIGDRTAEVNALADVVDTTVDIANKERAKAEKIELDAIQTKLRSVYNEQLAGKNGFKNRKRKDALDMQGQYEHDYVALTDKTLEGVSNPRVLEQAKQYRDKLGVDYNHQLNVHSSREREKYDDENTMTAIASIQNIAIDNYKDISMSASLNNQKETSRINASVQELNSTLEAYADRKGMSPEKLKELQLNATSNLHNGVINKALANGEDLLARDYYNTIKERGELNAETSTKLDRLINKASIKGESQRSTDNIMSQGLGLSESLELARKEKDPDVRDETVRRVRQRWNEKDVIKRDQQERRGLQLANIISEDGGEDNIPIAQLDELTSSQRAAIKEYSNLVSQGLQPKTDPVLLLELKTMASDPVTQKKFLRTDLSRFVHKLNTSDMKMLTDYKASIRKGDSSKDAEFGRFLSNTKVMKNVSDSLGITDKKERSKFEAAVMEQANVWEQTNGKKIPNAELEEIANRLGMEVEVEGTFYDPDKRLFEVEPDEVIASVSYENIPRKTAAKIREYLNKKGIPFTKEQAVDLYKQSLTMNK